MGASKACPLIFKYVTPTKVDILANEKTAFTPPEPPACRAKGSDCVNQSGHTYFAKLILPRVVLFDLLDI